MIKEVKARAGEMGLENNLKIMGRVLYSDVKKYFKASDMFVITSIYEGTCMVLHEAAICKLPIVATAFAGARDFIKDHENGFRTDVKDYRAIAERIIYLLEYSEDAKRMGEEGYKKVKKMYNKDLVLEKYKGLFEKAIK
ncbi:MAG: glycosyltransferase family 4 protein [Patescibacteria group bacterium]|nr:glycosyltransferase family 4 protein [Patescibacteria group bacterium]